ncbi:MAG: hypothetical protein P0116_00955 [Candidatus Nitrosocosmicus sp.]|nr:hypothetical protein [Candidatus Nitrosocosmicus sp.]
MSNKKRGNALLKLWKNVIQRQINKFRQDQTIYTWRPNTREKYYGLSIVVKAEA